jgi:hypothetical protein
VDEPMQHQAGKGLKMQTRQLIHLSAILFIG